MQRESQRDRISRRVNNGSEAGPRIHSIRTHPGDDFFGTQGRCGHQDRPGPNRSAIPVPGVGEIRGFGMVHNFSDVVKLIFKEDFIPAKAQKWLYILAPAVPVITALLTPALIPWFAPIVIDQGGQAITIAGSIIEANSSLLLLFALGAVSVFGMVIGPWASNSKYSLLGGLRSSAMMISYEISMGLGILGLVLIIGSFSIADIVDWQAQHAWGVIVQPVGFFLFLVSMFAETGRTPFDVAEGESEIVGGFHTEYSSIKFALYFMGEYAHVVIASALISVLFFGGYHLPFLGTEVIQTHTGWVLAGALVGKGILLGLLALMVNKQKAHYATLAAKDQAVKQKEYGFFRILFAAGAVACVIGALICVIVIPTGKATIIDGVAVYPLANTLLTAATQLAITLAKTLFFCWVFVWVRWTLPRIRYDQIMGLGWKVLINVALINLVITAIIVKMIGG